MHIKYLKKLNFKIKKADEKNGKQHCRNKHKHNHRL
jgi:hypothetical protein